LLITLQQQGIILTPLPGDKLEIRLASRLTPELRAELRQRKAEVLALHTRPHINPQGELILPFTSDPKYHWWAGGQSILETLRELGAPPDVVARYVDSESSLKRMQ
jgi:hypothetical protein